MFVRHKGHSKWQNIKATKEANDGMYAKLTNMHVSFISKAIRDGGNETRPEYNRNLERAIKAALAEGVTKVTIDRAIKRHKDAPELVETLVEVRGPGNCFILVEMLVKNPRLAIPEVNRITKKKGGMVDSGMKNIFERRGRIVAKPPPGAGDAYSTDKAEEDAIEFGAEEADFDAESGLVEFLSGVDDFPDVKSAIEENKFEVIFSKVEYIPSQTIELTTDREIEAFNGLIAGLEASEMATAVHHNVDL